MTVRVLLWLQAALLCAATAMGSRPRDPASLENVRRVTLTGAYPSPGLQLVIGAERGAASCRFELFPVDSPINLRTRVTVPSADATAAFTRLLARPRAYLGANGCGEGSWARVTVLKSSKRLTVIDATVAVTATSPASPLLFSIRSLTDTAIDRSAGNLRPCAGCYRQSEGAALGTRIVAVRTDPVHADKVAVAQLCALTRVALDKLSAILSSNPSALRASALRARTDAAVPPPLGTPAVGGRRRHLQMHTRAPPYKRLRGCPKDDTYELDIGVVVDHGFVRGRRAAALFIARGGRRVLCGCEPLVWIFGFVGKTPVALSFMASDSSIHAGHARSWPCSQLAMPAAGYARSRPCQPQPCPPQHCYLHCCKQFCSLDLALYRATFLSQGRHRGCTRSDDSSTADCRRDIRAATWRAATREARCPQHRRQDALQHERP